MADYNSSLPVRTQNNGDVVIQIADGTTPSQKAAVDSSGGQIIAGEGVAGTPAGGVVSIQGVAGGTAVPISGSITATNPSVSNTGAAVPAQATFIGGEATTSAPTYVNGDLEPLSLTLAGALRVDGSASTQPVSGTVTANQGTAAALAGAWPVEITDGTNILGTSAHPVRIDPTGTTTQPVSGTVTANQGTSPWVTSVNNLPATVDTNYGTVGASTIRTAAQIGNATGAADFNAGATGAQTLRVVANQGAPNATPWNENIAQISGSAPSASNALPTQISTGSAFVSTSNPLPVEVITPIVNSSPVDDYKDATAIAIGATDNHDYTVTAGKTLHLTGFELAASGKFKSVIQVETGVSTGTFVIKYTRFNSTATPSDYVPVTSGLTVAAGVRVRVAMTNNDLSAQDLYSTISGYEV